MINPVVAQRFPYAIDVEAEKTYFWCACGKSSNQPFCDGSHAGSSFLPIKYTAKEPGKVYFCGCKMSQKAPLCDGAHKNIPD